MRIPTESYGFLSSQLAKSPGKAFRQISQLLLLLSGTMFAWSAEAACPTTPLQGCTVLEKGTLNARIDSKPTLAFKAVGNVPIMGDPVATHEQNFCAYDVYGQKIFDFSVAAAGTDSKGKPYWKSNKRGDSHVYKNSLANEDGVVKMHVVTAKKLQTVAQGDNLVFAEAFSAPFLVQHSSANDSCAELVFGEFKQKNSKISAAVKGDTPDFNLVDHNLTYTAGANGSITGTSPQTVNHGASGTPVTAVPNTGYHFVSWNDANGDNPRTDANVTSDISVTANFAINSYTLTYTTGANGSVTGTSPQTVDHGNAGSAVTAVPDANYSFVNWSDGSTANPRTDSNVTSDISVTANFELDSYTLTYTAGANGNITGISPQTVSHGDNGNAVNAVPDTGYQFVNWSDGSTANPRTDANVTGDISVTANFAINSYTLTYTAGANGSITGTSPQTVDHGNAGSAVTAVPDANYSFVNWSDGSTANPRTDSNVTSDISVTANFELDSYTLTYTAGANGSITGISPQTVSHGDNGSAVNAVPDASYSFVNWSDGSTDNPRTDTNVTADLAVTANFVANIAPSFDAPPANSNMATSGQNYSFTFTTSDADRPGDTCTMTAPTLPAWMNAPTLNNTNCTIQLTGTPGDGDVGTGAGNNVSLNVTDGAGAMGTLNFNIEVDEAPPVPAPVALADTFNGIGNTAITVGSPTPMLASSIRTPFGSSTRDSVLDNDTTEGGATLAVTLDSGPTPGGTLDLETDGSFSLIPPPGVTSVSFDYTITQTVGGDVQTSAAATVTVNFANRVWYVDGSAGAGGNGTSAAPFQTTSAGSTAATAANDIIFVSGGTYTSGATLSANGQQLIGEGAGLAFNVDVDNSGGMDGSQTLVAAGSRPRISNAAGNAIGVSADNSIVKGLDIGGANTSGNGINLASGVTVADAISITQVTGKGIRATSGELTVTGLLTINATGGGIDLSGGVQSSFDNGMSVTATNGIGLLASSAGVTTFGSAANSITATGGEAVRITNTMAGGFCAWCFSNLSSSNSPGNGVSLDSLTENFTVSGQTKVTASAGEGVKIAGGNATLNFGDLDISNNAAAAGAGLVASGGSAKLASTSGTINSGNEVGVSISGGPSIDAAGMTLTSVSANGATNGIVLNGIGNGGTFAVVGDGSTGTQGGNDSGGIIQGTGGDGVVLTNAQNISLGNMTIGDPTVGTNDTAYGTNNLGGDGIQADGVTNLSLKNITIARPAAHGLNADNPGGAVSLTNLTLEDSLILNAGDGQEEHGLNLDELRGDNFVRRCLFDGFNETGLELVNTSGSVDLTVDNTSFQDNKATAGNAGEEAILIESQGTANVVVLVTGDASLATTQSIFDDIKTQSVQGIASDTSTLHVTVENSRHLESSAGDGIILVSPDNSASANLTVRNNEFTDDTFGPFAVVVTNNSSGSLDTTVQSNTVTNMQLLGASHDDAGSSGAANGTTYLLVGGAGAGAGNTVDVGGNFVAVGVTAEESVATGPAPDVHLTVQNNTTTQPDGNFTFTQGLDVTARDATRMNANITGNSFQGDPTFAGGSGIELREQDAAVVGLQGFGGGNAAATQAFIDGANPSSSAGSFLFSHDSNFGGGTPTLPATTTRPSP